tara:strand:+ start:156 stop:431 length:276 start_codon:yes stop_codon:yes gene_type:complete
MQRYLTILPIILERQQENVAALGQGRKLLEFHGHRWIRLSWDVNKEKALALEVTFMMRILRELAGGHTIKHIVIVSITQLDQMKMLHVVGY